METLALPFGMLCSPSKTPHGLYVVDQPERTELTVACGSGVMPSPCNYRRRNVGKGSMIFPEDIYVQAGEEQEMTNGHEHDQQMQTGEHLTTLVLQNIYIFAVAGVYSKKPQVMERTAFPRKYYALITTKTQVKIDFVQYMNFN